MHIGVCIFATDYAIRIDELAREPRRAASSRSSCPSTPTFR
jgi:hypothetical protein